MGRMSATSEHSIVEGSPVYPVGSRVNEHGHLVVGGCDVVDLVAEFGTPTYIYAEDDLRARDRRLGYLAQPFGFSRTAGGRLEACDLPRVTGINPPTA